MTFRLYFSDWQVLALIKLHGYGYTEDIALTLKKTRRAIAYTLKKLEKLKLIERVGNPRCPFQWFQLNPYDIEKVKGLIKYLGVLFSLRKFQKNCCFFFNEKDFYVLVGKRSDPSRPWGFSLSWREQDFFRDLHRWLRKLYPFHPLKPPDLELIRHGRGTFQIGILTGRAGWRFYWGVV